LTTPPTAARRTPDAVTGWVDRLPVSLRPYARLMRADRPVGTWLLFWPTAWGVALAGGVPRLVYLLLLFWLGAFAMRAAGCVYNDIVDRRLDAAVARTRARPLASGEVSIPAAWVLLVALSLLGLLVLLQLPAFAQAIAIASLLLVAAYPFMKRLIWWPQAWLGLTFNWGALVGYAAVADALPDAALLLYGAGIFWTLGYDTIYALQDIEDDALAGIKSSARRLGGKVRIGVGAFYGASTALFGAALVAAGADVAVAFAALLPAAAHFVWQVARLEPESGAIALSLFRSNSLTGALVFAIIVATKL
jgi:4-hydroxybenzoate polyprenyltransferase